MIRSMLVTPKTPTAAPNPNTIQGLVRQRAVPPSALNAASTRYASTPSAASGTGSVLDTHEWRTISLPFPKSGSQTRRVTPI